MRAFFLLSALLAALTVRGQLVYEKNLGADLGSVDANGNAYVVTSHNLIKLGPDGSVVYSKALPAPGGWSAIGVDAVGNIALAGTTLTDALVATPGVFQPKRNTSGTCVSGDKNAAIVPCADVIVAKFDPSGTQVWATYLGGSLTEQATSVALDGSGNVLVAGLTSSSDFPVVSGFQKTFGGYADGFVVKIAADGAKILYSSFMGGAAYDYAHAIAVDAAGNAYVAGEAASGVPFTSGSFGANCQDSGTHAFVLKVSATGSLVYGGCLGSAAGYSAATAISVDSSGNAYVGGVTNTKDFPKTTGALDSRTSQPYADFLAKISNDGARLIYSALLDGGSFGIYSVGVDSSGAVVAGGSTGSAAIAAAGAALQPCAGPSYLAYNFLLQLNPAGSALTYFSYEDALQHTISVAPAPDGSVVEAGGLVRKFTTLENSGGPYVSSFCVLNGASFVSHLQYGQPGISPGELVTLKGTGLGPAMGAGFTLSGNTVPVLLAGTRVLFDGVPAPVVYAQDRQINVVAPYALSGKAQTTIQVEAQGKTGAAVTLPVSVMSPAVFQNFQSFTPLVLNQDFSLNSVNNPAARGSAVVLYITGGGQTTPPSTDGEVSQSAGGLVANTAAKIQNTSGSAVELNVALLYAGPAPGLISSVQQINVQIPADLPNYFLSGVAAGNNYLSVTVGTQTVVVPVVIR